MYNYRYVRNKVRFDIDIGFFITTIIIIFIFVTFWILKLASLLHHSFSI
jgi:hypothetical protein